MMPTTGYTYDTPVKPANKSQLIALRDALLLWNDKNAAAAVDNVIDILSRVANPVQQTSENVTVIPSRLESIRPVFSAEMMIDLEIWQQEVEETRKSDYPR